MVGTVPSFAGVRRCWPWWWTRCLALQPRHVNVNVTTPDKIYIGEHGTVTAAIAPARRLGATRFEMLLEQGGDADPPQESPV